MAFAGGFNFGSSASACGPSPSRRSNHKPHSGQFYPLITAGSGASPFGAGSTSGFAPATGTGFGAQC